LRLKSTIVFIFIITYSLFFYINTQSKNDRIQHVLDEKLDTLQTHYDITKEYFVSDAQSISQNISKNKKFLELFSKAQYSSKEQKDILREKVYKLLLPIYNRIKIRGVSQVHITFTNNISFLRMHKPKRYGDDLTNIRYSFKHSNKTKSVVEGFEQGRSEHSLRYTFPIYNKENNHLGSIDISLSSKNIQDKLLNVNMIHSHFLVNKDILNKKVSKLENIKSRYIQSIEHKDYMFAINSQHSLERLKVSQKNIITPLRKEIDKNFSTSEPFSLFVITNNTSKVISFLPIYNIINDTVIAYIVSYANSNNIYYIYQNYKYANIGVFIGLLLLCYFIYRNLNYKKELEIEVKKKTKDLKKTSDDLKYLNENLEVKIELKIKELAFEKQELEKAQKIANLGSWKLDFTTNKLHWSNEIFNIFEVDKNKFEATYDAFINAVHPEDIEMVNNAYLKSLEDKNEYYITHRLLMKDGRIKWVKEQCESTFDEEGKALFSAGIVIDITDLKNKEKQLLESEKIASMGEMIGNIARQWRQPLSAISTASTGMLLQKEYNILSNEEFSRTCNMINDNAQYLSKTIDDFKNFIKGDRKKSIFSLTNDIDNFLHLVEGPINNNHISIILDLEDEIKVNGYENELTQCFINIFNNAKDAYILNDIKNKLLFISTTTKKDKVIITIKDNAKGIPKSIIKKIFEPYFTTKHQSQGTGLGLNMSYNIIVDGMNGTIEASNKSYIYKDTKYSGAIFTITIPIS